MLDQDGEGCQNAQKQFIIKAHQVTDFYTRIRVEGKAKIRNPYNQVPHLTRGTIWISDKTQENTTHNRAKQTKQTT